MAIDLKRASLITVTASNAETLTWGESPLLTNASSFTTTTWSSHCDSNRSNDLSVKPVDSYEADHKLARISSAVQTILDCIDEHPEREGLRDTPKRYAKAMLFFTKGYRENIEEVLNGAIFEDDCNELVTVQDIEVHSMCEHHLVPFTGKIHIGYVPKGKVLGLSKFARIVEMFARRLQIQERLTRQVASAIQTSLQPEGVAVMMESSHMCMVMRGVQKQSAVTTTQCMLGVMKSDRTIREDFLASLGKRR